jgi:hypothetical protein
MKKEIKPGFKLLFVGIVLLAVIYLLPFLFATVAVPGVALAFVPVISLEGLNGEALEAMQGLQKRFKDVDLNTMTKEEIKAFVENANKEIKAAQEKFKDVDVAKLVAMTDETKGVMAILKTLGMEVTALKESTGNQAPKGKTFKEWFHSLLPEIEKVYNAHEGSKQFVAKAAVIMTSENVVDYSALPTDLIDSFSLGSFVEKRRPREYVFDLATVTNVAEVEKYKVWEEEGSEQGAFAIVAQGAIKPLVSLTLVKNISTAQKVAGKYVVTEEFTKWRKNAYAIIQRLIKQKMLRDYAAILTTDLLAASVPYTASALDGQYQANLVTDYHAIAAVAAQIEALDFMPDMLVMNPQDKWRIGMSQDTVGQFYLTIPITDPSGQTRMMGFILRTSNRVPVGSFILGESGLWEIEQEAIKIKVGYGLTITGGTDNGGGNVTNVSGDFDNNRFRVILETYFHDYIATNNIGSFVYASFATVKAAVTAA